MKLWAILFSGIPSCSGVLKGCHRVSVSFERNSWFGLRSDTVQALDQVTCDFAPGITTLIGPSGSGKSTLGRVIVNQEEGQEFCKGGGRLIFDHSNSTRPQFSYGRQSIDPFFYDTYDSSRSAYALLNLGPDSIMAEKALSLSGVSFKESVGSLLESERRMFEIILALSKLKGSGRPVLVLDEYLDKDDLSVKRKVARFMRALCQDPEVGLQVFIITHSRGVVETCSDFVVALCGGRVFHQGEPGRVRFPSQLILTT